MAFWYFNELDLRGLVFLLPQGTALNGTWTRTVHFAASTNDPESMPPVIVHSRSKCRESENSRRRFGLDWWGFSGLGK